MYRIATRQSFFLTAFTLIATLSFAQQLRQLSFYGFGNGQSPSSGLIQDAQGNFYGATNKGGNFDEGVIYEVTALPSAQLTVLHQFGSFGEDGIFPLGNLVIDQAGNLYGVTQFGGTGTCQCGTVYELSPPSQPGGTWTETIVYSFQGTFNNDGSTPMNGLVFDQAGNLYGTLSEVGLLGGGNIYELSPPSQPGGTWTETILAVVPTAESVGLFCTLVIDSQGNLYGTTQYGGNNNKGSVFEVSPPSQPGQPWNVAILHSFYGTLDGEYPLTGLTLGQGKSVALFGITSTSINPQGVPGPVVFVLLPPPQPGGNWIFEVVEQLSENLGLAEAPLVWSGPVTLFGTATAAGGSIFELSIAGGVPNLVAFFNFQALNQVVNLTTPVLVGNHALYGTTQTGGTGICGTNQQGCGTVFQLTP